MMIDQINKFAAACIFSLVFAFTPTQNVFSQTSIKGKIVNIKDGKPVAYATVSVSKRKANTLSDKFGNFSLSLRELRNNDSLFITSIGFRSLSVLVNDAMLRNEFSLYEQAEDLQDVVIKSYTNEATVGSRSELTGFFRSWNQDKKGGEIGKIFYVKEDDYKLERVRFKVNNFCDTCSIRLHIREVENGAPGKEILTDSISKLVHKLSYDDRFTEFDLRPYEMILKNKALFVGLEILSCSKQSGKPCSICYIGTEEGDYIYKNSTDSRWEIAADFSIYLKLFYKY